MPRRRHEVIVIGGGTAGIAAAVRLAECGVDVCLVEAGPSDLETAAVHDIRGWQEVLGSDLDFAVPAEPPHSRIVYSAGRLLGGGSSLNNAWAFDLPDDDLLRWEAAGLREWTPSALDAERISVSARVAAEPVRFPHPPSCAFLEAMAEWGVPSAQMGGRQLTSGAGWVPLSARDSVRRSSADVYLDSERNPPAGLTVEVGTVALRVLLERGRVVGVETDRGTLTSDEVVVSCGALHTPRLLMLSGIGPADHLRSWGISVVVDSPEVGQNLQDHPLVGVTWRARSDVPVPTTHGWEAAALLSCSVTDEEHDLMVLCAAAPPSLAGAAQVEGNLTVAAYLARPKSRGSVRLQGATIDHPVRVDAPILTDDAGADRDAMAAAMGIVRQIGHQRALAAWLGEEADPGVDADLIDYVLASTGTMFHPTSTARMGSDTASVVTTELRVRGVDGLRVADASVLPTVPTVPPYLTCLTIGERCARLMTESS